MREQDSENIKYIYRLPPCPAYDVEGTESWLCGMAEKGLMLAEDGFFLGFAAFVRSEPRQVQYRLEAAPSGGFLEDTSTPDTEAVAYAERYGWEYVARRGEFYIYRAESADARELNTDPAVQALAMKAVRSRQWGILFEWVFWLVLYPLLRNGGAVLGSPMLTTVTLGLPLTVFSVVMLAWLVGRSVVCAVTLLRIYRRLKRGEALEHRKNWQRRARQYQVMTVVRTVLVTVWIVVLAATLLNWMSEADEVTLDEYTAAQEIPFATLTDFAAELGTVSGYRSLYSGWSNTVRAWSDVLSPCNLEYSEIADVTLADGRIVEGMLDVDYHKTAAPWIAAQIAREYHRLDRRDEDYQALDISLSEVDFAVAYLDEMHRQTVVICRGEIVVHASFYSYASAENIPLDVWAAVLAESLAVGD